MSFSEEELKAIARILEQRTKEEYERKLRWGELGPPINFVWQGTRLVAAYNELLSIHPNATYHDFLREFVQRVFGSDWWRDELKKAENERHLIVRWHDETQRMMIENSTGVKDVHEMAMPAATGKLLNLSFALHQIRHQGLLLPSLVKRLKDVRQFQGAFYEAVVSAAFSRAGFQVALEPEGKDDMKRCEFVATHTKTGKAYSVEAKSRHLPGVLGHPPSDAEGKREPFVERLILKALDKHADHDRVICIDVNHAQAEGKVIPEWAEVLKDQVEGLESGGHGPAMLIFTNSPFHYQPPLEPAYGQNSLVTGLNEDRFQNRDLHALDAALPGLIGVAESFNLAIPGRWD